MLTPAVRTNNLIKTTMLTSKAKEIKSNIWARVKKWWWTDPNFQKDEAWNERDKYIFGKEFNRWLIPPAAVAFHFCIGSLYAW
jgi:hypothetical protein